MGGLVSEGQLFQSPASPGFYVPARRAWRSFLSCNIFSSSSLDRASSSSSRFPFSCSTDRKKLVTSSDMAQGGIRGKKAHMTRGTRHATLVDLDVNSARQTRAKHFVQHREQLVLRTVGTGSPASARVGKLYGSRVARVYKLNSKPLAKAVGSCETHSSTASQTFLTLQNAWGIFRHLPALPSP